MLGKADATPMIAVEDIDRARQFYGETLGLKHRRDGRRSAEVKSGATTINVYRSRSPHQQGDRADLRGGRTRRRCARIEGQGVSFNITTRRALSTWRPLCRASMKTTWFKDPDGNILSLFEGDGS